MSKNVTINVYVDNTGKYLYSVSPNPKKNYSAATDRFVMKLKKNDQISWTPSSDPGNQAAGRCIKVTFPPPNNPFNWINGTKTFCPATPQSASIYMGWVEDPYDAIKYNVAIVNQDGSATGLPEDDPEVIIDSSDINQMLTIFVSAISGFVLGVMAGKFLKE